MPIRLYNSLTKTKEDFAPLDPANVRMYVCGPTVYDFAHIGNARPAIVFDVLFRLLKHEYEKDGGKVTYVRNITDVDDKINARALRDYPGLPLNQAIRNVTEKTEAQYQADVTALGCLPPTHQPRATEHINGMIAMIQTLLDKDHAYVAQGDEGREALFDIKKMSDYGRLSGRNLDDQLAGARVEAKDYKRNPGDFVLWKESNSDEPGWDANFRLSDANRKELRLNSNVVGIRGRPGWHIECSVMSEVFLGKTFDIHGGGLDLIFPHHENEIAQSRCAHGTSIMAKYWMHNGFLQVEGEKMSKSAGNFFTIRELLADWPGEVLRFNMLRTHYRQPIDWTLKSLEESRDILEKWRRAVASVGAPQMSVIPLDFVQMVADDLNVPGAIRLLHDYARQANGFVFGGGEYAPASDENRRWGAGNLLMSATFIGIDLTPKNVVLDDDIKRAIATRNAARAAKNWAESDRIRDELLAKGIVLKDGPNGTTWEVKR